jgi:hypothetical protein
MDDEVPTLHAMLQQLALMLAGRTGARLAHALKVRPAA